MPKIKLTKGELKRRRDALRQYERYLPILQLKKKQLQVEILHQIGALNEKRRDETSRMDAIAVWAGLLAEPDVALKRWVSPLNTLTSLRNVAGADVPIFDRVEFEHADYDLFASPLWIDAAIEALRTLVSVREEMKTMEAAVQILRGELRVTTQRVNLFEKVKIPEAADAVRRIKIFIGDQMANAVGRSKIAKRKIELVEAI